jgi:hypothetical protein
LDSGVSWHLIDAMSTEQTEFKSHSDWCKVYLTYQQPLKDYVAKDIEANGEEWAARPFQPSIELNIIEGRKMEALPKGPDYYSPPPGALFQGL